MLKPSLITNMKCNYLAILRFMRINCTDTCIHTSSLAWLYVYLVLMCTCLRNHKQEKDAHTVFKHMHIFKMIISFATFNHLSHTVCFFVIVAAIANVVAVITHSSSRALLCVHWLTHSVNARTWATQCLSNLLCNWFRVWEKCRFQFTCI